MNVIYFRGTRKKKSKTEGNRGTKKGNIENQDFDFGEQGKMPIFSGNKGIGTPWEGLINRSLHSPFGSAVYRKLKKNKAVEG